MTYSEEYETALEAEAARTAELYTALAKAQGSFPDIEKNRIATVRTKTGGEFKFKYADLSDVLRCVRGPLAENDLSVTQVIANSVVTTTLYHAGGAKLSSTYPVHDRAEGRMHPAQEYAIAVMYARRYALTALLGVATDESVQDDRNKMVSERFEDPTRDGIIGVKGVTVKPDADPAERAKEYAKGIEAQFYDVKTPAGLNGVWDRNSKVIDRLQDSYPAEYENLLDVYEARRNAINVGAAKASKENAE